VVFRAKRDPESSPPSAGFKQFWIPLSRRYRNKQLQKEAPLRKEFPHLIFLPPSEFFGILIFTKSLPYLLYTFNIDDYYMFEGSGNTGPGAEGTS